MMNVEREQPQVVPRSAWHALRIRVAGLVRGVSGAVPLPQVSAATLIAHLPGTVNATRASAHGTTSALQSLPDTTLRSLAGTSVGLGAGLYLAGAPRLVVAAGVAPAIVMGAAMVLRPIGNGVESDGTTPARTLEPGEGAR